MKIYELMNKLKDLPAGAEVRVRTLKTMDEMSLYDDDPELYEICYPVQSVEINDSSSTCAEKYVDIDCY